MTKADVLPRTRSIIGLIRDFFWIATVMTPLMLVMLYGLYALNRDWIVATVRAELGIERLATAASVERLAGEVSALVDGVRRANGEARIIRQPPGRSYIREPVRQGQNVVMIMVAERTELGRNCRLEQWVPIFTDERNIPTPGERAAAGPVRRQLDDELMPLRIEMVPPATMMPGRVTVYLALDYRCRDRLFPDVSETLAYQLLPSQEGETK